MPCFKELSVCRYFISLFKPDDISGDKICTLDKLFSAIAQHADMGYGHFFQGTDSVFCFIFLNKSQCRVQHDNSADKNSVECFSNGERYNARYRQKDDEYIFPLPEKHMKNRGCI